MVLWIEGYEGLYSFDEKGNVYSHHTKYNGTPHLMTGSVPDKRYIVITLCNKGTQSAVKPHRLVAKAFIPNPENKPHVNHKDKNTHNNNVSNLEWVTAKENAQHSWDNGRELDVEMMNKLHQLKCKCVQQICIITGEVVAEYSSVVEAGRVLGRDKSAIAKACRGVQQTAYGFKWRYKEV